jgi:hypothetical protein
MMETATKTPGPQRMRALERANEVRLARAVLKRRIAEGEMSAAEVILDCPWEASSWGVGDLLMSQRRWGSTRCRKFLGPTQISEVKPVGALTERQRRLLATKLAACEVAIARLESQLEQRPRVSEESGISMGPAPRSCITVDPMPESCTAIEPEPCISADRELIAV